MTSFSLAGEEDGALLWVMPHLNHPFKTALNTLIRYKDYITNAIELPYSNAKLEATNKLIKDIKRNAFRFRNVDNFKKLIYACFEHDKREDDLRLLSCLVISHPRQTHERLFPPFSPFALF
ncbi:transposase [Streptococcus equi subsp. zooepidemicus SzAM60]|nr:transposase [Streptococcus equi subsp. zooepidemicus SzAM60]